MGKNGVATRADPHTGFREVVGFLGFGSQQMFGCTYVPAGQPTGGVVICCPLQAEFLKNYRREVLLARSLASQGVAVQRFHYRGSGNSLGESYAETYETMLDDTLAAADWLAQQTGVSNFAFLGTRASALVAASAASRRTGAPLALWAPIDPSRYFREVFRARLIGHLKQGAGNGSTSAGSAHDEMRRSGFVEVLGYAITSSLYKSMISRSLIEELGTTPRPVLLVQIEAGGRLRHEYANIAHGWIDLGFDVECKVIDLEQAWWFGGGGWETREEPFLTEELSNRTCEWMIRAFSQLNQ
jgi:hypothetical protein